ncbi:MAG TPA: hypothetical protein VNZ46_02370, partial [Pedobacter sp.]|nr:hypothetical protein [Pedobacter sp.]
MNALSIKLLDRAKSLLTEPTGKENIDQGERVVSLLAGGWLLFESLKNMKKHPLIGLQVAAASGLLL